jgi:hypothetical protein
LLYSGIEQSSSFFGLGTGLVIRLGIYLFYTICKKDEHVFLLDALYLLTRCPVAAVEIALYTNYTVSQNMREAPLREAIIEPLAVELL